MRNFRTQSAPPEGGAAPARRGGAGFGIALHLREINALVNARVTEELASSGLTLPQITAIRLLAHSGELPMTELAREMNASPSTVAGIVDRLEAGGIVERRRDREDRRVVRAAITARGSERADRAREAVESCFARAFEGIGEAELAALERGLAAAVSALRGPRHEAATAAAKHKE